MKQKKHNSRRRLNTPQNRLKRAVGYRYEKRSMMNAPHFQAARQAEENPAVISSDSFASAPVVQHDRKTRKREWVNAMVMLPNASLFKTSVHPMKTLEDAANSVYLSLGTCKGLFWNLLLWLLISADAASIYSRHIEKLEFSIARFNFTDTCWLAVRIALFCLVMVYTGYLAAFLIGKLFHKEVYYQKIAEVDALSSLPCAFVFALSLLLLVKAHGLGIFIFAVGVCLCMAWKLYGLYLNYRYDWKLALSFGAGYAVAFLCLYQVFYHIFLRDLMVILEML